MKKMLIVGIVLSAMSSTAVAQTLYMPRPVKKAFAKQTRSPDGRPGPKYWQNRGRYSISITAAPPDRNVKGSEQITYFNNSPDTLKSLVYRFIVNIHKAGAPRAGGASSDYLTPGVQIDAFTVNNAWTAPVFYIGVHWVTKKGIVFRGDGSSTQNSLRQFGLAGQAGG